MKPKLAVVVIMTIFMVACSNAGPWLPEYKCAETEAVRYAQDYCGGWHGICLTGRYLRHNFEFLEEERGLADTIGRHENVFLISIPGRVLGLSGKRDIEVDLHAVIEVRVIDTNPSERFGQQYVAARKGIIDSLEIRPGTKKYQQWLKGMGY